ncbi:hypothetical protein BB050_02045 [Flavobacterium anhuiense]|uniref:Uncharacterized protein n=1 Tax=Flavobacterium anhuiense TaxID=459526 RepID=A0AAC9GIB0_9FLAO|nr:hypothetical protein BB050_02045 [Flavobacterium anhuiense]
MLSGLKSIQFCNLEFHHCSFAVDKELFPAIRCNLFMANPAIKRISAPIGAMDAVSGEAFREMEDFGKMKKCLKISPKAEDPLKADIGKPDKIRKCQPNQEKPYAR